MSALTGAQLPRDYNKIFDATSEGHDHQLCYASVVTGYYAYDYAMPPFTNLRHRRLGENIVVATVAYVWVKVHFKLQSLCMFPSARLGGVLLILFGYITFSAMRVGSKTVLKNEQN